MCQRQHTLLKKGIQITRTNTKSFSNQENVMLVLWVINWKLFATDFHTVDNPAQSQQSECVSPAEIPSVCFGSCYCLTHQRNISPHLSCTNLSLSFDFWCYLLNLCLVVLVDQGLAIHKLSAMLKGRLSSKPLHGLA